jgi:hypothetical protein
MATKGFDLSQLAPKVSTSAVLAVTGGGTGVTTLTTGNLLVGAGTSAVTGIAAGTSGNTLTSNGTTWASTPNVAFSAHKNGTNQTGVVTATNTKVTFSTEDFDTNNNFASSTFTPTVAGRYILTCSVQFVSGVDQMYYTAAIYKNGAVYKEQYGRASGPNDFSTNVCVVVDANGSTDYFEAYVNHGAGSDRVIGGGAVGTYFAGARAL